MHRILTTLLLTCALLAGARADERFLRIDLERGAQVPLLVREQAGAEATLLLLPGGNANTGPIVDGLPTSRNFLVRARAALSAERYNVVVAFKPADLRTLELGYRRGSQHVGEIAQIVDWAQKRFGKPIWLVGTSRGTVSAAAAAAALGPRIAGVVLSSSISSSRANSVFDTDLAAIRVPVLVMHHAQDACRNCDPAAAQRIPAALRNAPVKKLLMIDGGANPEGDPCEALHWHGYIGYEKETAAQIAEWIRAPRGD